MVKKKKVTQRVNTKGQHYHVGSGAKKQKVYRRLSPYDRETMLNYRGENKPKLSQHKIKQRAKPSAKDLAKVKGSSGLTTKKFFDDGPHLQPRELSSKEYRTKLLKEKNDPHSPFWNDMDKLNGVVEEFTAEWYKTHTGMSKDEDDVVESISNKMSAIIFDTLAKNVSNPEDFASEHYKDTEWQILNIADNYTSDLFDSRDDEEDMIEDYASKLKKKLDKISW